MLVEMGFRAAEFSDATHHSAGFHSAALITSGRLQRRVTDLLAANRIFRHYGSWFSIVRRRHGGVKSTGEAPVSERALEGQGSDAERFVEIGFFPVTVAENTLAVKSLRCRRRERRSRTSGGWRQRNDNRSGRMSDGRC